MKLRLETPTEKYQFAAFSALVSVLLMFTVPLLFAIAGLILMILLLHAVVFLKPVEGTVKPWQSKGFLILTGFGCSFGINMADVIMKGDMWSLLFAALVSCLIWQSAQNDPVDIEF